MINKQIETLDDIKNLMEKSSRFLSLSGLSGISAGIIALLGAALAFFYLDYDLRYFDINRYFTDKMYIRNNHNYAFLIANASIMLVLALSAGLYFTNRKAKKKGIKVWDSTAKRLVINLFIPLIAGGIFCFILLIHDIIFLLAPVTLIFYGLALINASKYTLPDIRYLGLSEIFLGLLGSIFTGYGLILWAIGFGILHILYGTIMYRKYDRI